MPNDNNLDTDMTPENVTGYLKSKGYNDELAGRLATNVLANPYGGANYDHIQGTRKWIDSQAPSQGFTQQDRELNRTANRQTLLDAASKLRGTPTGTTQMGMYDQVYGKQLQQPQSPPQPQNMSVMTPQGVKVVPQMVGQWLIKNKQAQPLAAAKGQPGSYLAQALPMATSMTQKWNIDQATAAAITTKLLSPVKDEEMNPVVGAMGGAGGQSAGGQGYAGHLLTEEDVD